MTHLVVISDTTLFFYRRLKQIEDELSLVRRKRELARIMETHYRNLWVSLETSTFMEEAKSAHVKMTEHEREGLFLERQEREVTERVMSYVKSRT